MPGRYSGPLGKEFRGNRAQAMELQGVARKLVEQCFDHIKGRSAAGKGCQYMTQVMWDGSTVHAYVLGNIQPPIVRTWIESPVYPRTDRVTSPEGVILIGCYTNSFVYNEFVDEYHYSPAKEGFEFLSSEKLDSFKLVQLTSNFYNPFNNPLFHESANAILTDALMVSGIYKAKPIISEFEWGEEVVPRNLDITHRLFGGSTIETHHAYDLYPSDNYRRHLCQIYPYAYNHSFCTNGNAYFALRGKSKFDLTPYKTEGYCSNRINPYFIQEEYAVDVFSADGAFVYTVDLPEVPDNDAAELPPGHCANNDEYISVKYRLHVSSRPTPVPGGFLVMTADMVTSPGMVRVVRVNAKSGEQPSVAWVAQASAYQEFAINFVAADLRVDTLTASKQYFAALLHGRAIMEVEYNIVLLGRLSDGVYLRGFNPSVGENATATSIAIVNENYLVIAFAPRRGRDNFYGGFVATYSIPALLNNEVKELYRISNEELCSAFGAPPTSLFHVRSDDAGAL